jgi:regulator of protease activity HflC (stomatin/prohibitin superfamily)
MSLQGQLLAVLADPNVSFVLLMIGIIGVVGEFHHPGTLVPGIVGALTLMLALLGFSELGVNWIGVTLVVLAAGLFVAEAHTPGFGLLALAGILAFVAGSWLLFVPLSGPVHATSGGRISLWLIGLGVLAVGSYILIVVRAVLRTRHLPSATGAEALLGREGVSHIGPHAARHRVHRRGGLERHSGGRADRGGRDRGSDRGGRCHPPRTLAPRVGAAGCVVAVSVTVSHRGGVAMLVVAFVLVSLVLALGLVLAGQAIRIVPEYQRLVVLRLGRLIGVRGPGLVRLIPLVDRGIRADLRERVFDVTPQSCITQDNAFVSIDFLIYSKIVDPASRVVNVQQYEGASRGIAITTLRAVVGDMLLDEVLSRREDINNTLRGKLDEVTSRWGIKVTAVEIREIIPPREIQEAMTRQMSAERSRRAIILDADGKRDAAVRVADGQKQATILEAEGARQAAILRAEGYAQALEQISAVAGHVDSNTMSLQYLDALKALGAAPSTKLVVPAEFTSLLRPLIEHTSGAQRATDDASGANGATPVGATARERS